MKVCVYFAITNEKIEHTQLEVEPGVDTVQDDSGKIPHHANDNKKSYITTRGETSNNETFAGPCNQESMMGKDNGTTEACGPFLLQAELQTLIASELENLKSCALKCAMMHRVEETLAEADEMGFLAAETSVKFELFRFIEMT